MTIFDNSRHVQEKNKAWMRQPEFSLFFYLISAQPIAPIKSVIFLSFLMTEINLGIINSRKSKSPHFVGSKLFIASINLNWIKYGYFKCRDAISH